MIHWIIIGSGIISLLLIFKIMKDLMHDYFEGTVVGIKNKKYYNIKLKESNVIISAILSNRLKWYKLKIVPGDSVTFYSENGYNVIGDRIF